MNNTAVQIFTNKGPIAFLPISNSKTSVVLSMRLKINENNFCIKELITRFNTVYKIKKIRKTIDL